MCTTATTAEAAAAAAAAATGLTHTHRTPARPRRRRRRCTSVTVGRRRRAAGPGEGERARRPSVHRRCGEGTAGGARRAFPVRHARDGGDCAGGRWWGAGDVTGGGEKRREGHDCCRRRRRSAVPTNVKTCAHQRILRVRRPGKTGTRRSSSSSYRGPSEDPDHHSLSSSTAGHGRPSLVAANRDPDRTRPERSAFRTRGLSIRTRQPAEKRGSSRQVSNRLVQTHCC